MDVIERQRMLDLINWIANNWFIPTVDGMWKLDSSNPEFLRTIPNNKGDLFTDDDLLDMFENGDGEF